MRLNAFCEMFQHIQGQEPYIQSKRDLRNEGLPYPRSIASHSRAASCLGLSVGHIAYGAKCVGAHLQESSSGSILLHLVATSLRQLQHPMQRSRIFTCFQPRLDSSDVQTLAFSFGIPHTSPVVTMRASPAAPGQAFEVGSPP